MALFSRDQRMFPQHPFRETVERIIATEHLHEAASNTADPEILLGLALLAQAGNPVRKELAARALKAEPQYARITALLPLMLDAVDQNYVSELIKHDPDNALGHYLLGNLLYQSGRESESLELFRKAGRCSELRLYEVITSRAIFKTVDALNFDGEDRLCILSWMATRLQNFSSTALQPLHHSLSELGRAADPAKRKEISDLLLILAGHLFATNFVNRWFGERALESAFALKAEVAASENSPTMFGYGAAGQKIPTKSIEASEIILLYDDHPNEHGCLPCILANCVGSHAPLETIQAQIRKRGDSGAS